MLFIKQEEAVVAKRNIFVLFVFMIALCMIGSVNVSAQLKFGYIDIQQILVSDQESIEAQEKLEEERQAAIQELQRMEEEFTKSQEALNQQSLLLSEGKRQERAQELQNMILEMNQYQQDKDQELTNRQTELMQPIYEKINEAIRKIRDRDGYDFIFDTISLLDAKEEYDLTEALLEVL